MAAKYCLCRCHATVRADIAYYRQIGMHASANVAEIALRALQPPGVPSADPVATVSACALCLVTHTAPILKDPPTHWKGKPYTGEVGG